jgi:glycosyltransferase involved in cell wall biosynthesis
MAEVLTRKLKSEILILPFFEDNHRQENHSLKTFEFCCVGLPSEHKNHELLLTVIKNLFQKKITFSIAITIPEVDANSDLLREIKSINGTSSGNISNFGLCDTTTVHEIYSKSRALIFPSKKESLGLPIIEALQHGLVILSADRDYSYELINNPITFDPFDPAQIEEKMRDFMAGKFSNTRQTLKIQSHINTIINMLLS